MRAPLSQLGRLRIRRGQLEADRRLAEQAHQDRVVELLEEAASIVTAAAELVARAQGPRPRDRNGAS